MSENREISPISEDEKLSVAETSPEMSEAGIDQYMSDPEGKAKFQDSDVEYYTDEANIQKKIECKAKDSSEFAAPIPKAKEYPYKMYKSPSKRPNTLELSAYGTKQQGEKSPISPISPLKRKMCDLVLDLKSKGDEVPTSKRRLSSDYSSESPSENIQLAEQQAFPRRDPSENIQLLKKQAFPSRDPSENTQLVEKQKLHGSDPSEYTQLVEKQKLHGSDPSEYTQLAEKQKLPDRDTSENTQITEQQESLTKKSVDPDSKVCLASTKQVDNSSVFKIPKTIPKRNKSLSPMKSKRIVVRHQRSASFDPAYSCRHLGCLVPATLAYRTPSGEKPAYHLHYNSEDIKEEHILTISPTGLPVEHVHIASPSKRKGEHVGRPSGRSIDRGQRQSPSGSPEGLELRFQTYRFRTPSGSPEVVRKGYYEKSRSKSPLERKDGQPLSSPLERKDGQPLSSPLERKDGQPLSSPLERKDGQPLSSPLERKDGQPLSSPLERKDGQPSSSQSAKRSSELNKSCIQTIMYAPLREDPVPKAHHPKHQTLEENKESSDTGEKSAYILRQDSSNSTTYEHIITYESPKSPEVSPLTGKTRDDSLCQDASNSTNEPIITYESPKSPEVSPLTGKTRDDSLCQAQASTLGIVDPLVTESGDPSEGTSDSEGSDDDTET